MGHEEVVPTLTQTNSGALCVGECLVIILDALFYLEHAVSHGYLGAPQESLTSHPGLLVCEWLTKLFNHNI